jgi:hypothetical protein
MPLDAGAVVTADELLRLQSRTYHQPATSDLAVGNTDTDIPGATIDIDVETDGATLAVIAVYDMDGVSSGSTAPCIGFINVDGSNVSEQALSQVGSASVNSRVTATQTWVGTVNSGTRTVKLKGTTPSGGVEINAVHTTLTVIKTEVV